MILLKTILVATDYSPASTAALTYGRELASNFGAQLIVVHVAGNLLTRPYAGGDGISFVDPGRSGIPAWSSSRRHSWRDISTHTR